MSRWKILAVSIVGNALEFYDFTLYGVLAASISQHFFPSSDPMASLLASLGAFAAGFLMRPFGATLFGFLGDRYGRKSALTISVLLMSIPTLIVGLLPTYQSIGVLAPLVIILCRLLQGLCTGGEYNGAAIFALEHIGKQYPGFSGGLITGSCAIGALVATGMGALVVSPGMPEWAWRVPFILGSFIGIVGYYIRSNLKETPEFLSSKPSTEKMPLVQVMQENRRPLVVAIAIGSLNGILSYMLLGFLTVYLVKFQGVDAKVAMYTNLLGFFSFMIASPVMGYVFDKKPTASYFLNVASAVFLMAYPIFLTFSSKNIFGILLGQISLGILAGAIGGPQHAFLQKMFPVNTRYSGIGFGFSTGMALLGGTTPMILTYMLDRTGNLMVPAVYLAIASVGFMLIIKTIASKPATQS